MRGSDADELPGLGRKVEPEPPKPVEPVWKPTPSHQGYETDGKAVRRVPEALIVDFFDGYV